MYNNGSNHPARQAKEDELISHMKASAGVAGPPPPPRPPGTTSSANNTINARRANLDDLFGEGSQHNPNNKVRAAGATPPPSSSPSAAQETSENLRRALRVSESTNVTGYATMQSLGMQRETIQNSMRTVDSTQQNLQESRQTIRQIRFEVYKEWFIKGCVIASLVALIILIIWVKFLRKR